MQRRSNVLSGFGAVVFLIGSGTANADTCPKTAFGLVPLPGMAKGVCQTYAVKHPDDSTACFWEFSYRAPAAVVLADAMWSRIKTCDKGQEQPRDQIVNHPDSYTPRTWVTDTAAKTVSIKDKAALNKTLVFLRVEPKN